mgnify:CR=1 FL=1
MEERKEIKVIKVGLPGFPFVVFRHTLEEVLKYYSLRGAKVLPSGDLFYEVHHPRTKTLYLWESTVFEDEYEFVEEEVPGLPFKLVYAYC